jgi:hypothetical protein
MKKGMGKERIGLFLHADQFVPGSLANFGQRRDDAGLRVQFLPRWKSGCGQLPME